MHRIITTIRFCIRIAAKMGITPPPPPRFTWASLQPQPGPPGGRRGVMPAAPRRRLAALLLGPLMVIGLLLGLASPAGAQTFPQPVGIGATPDEIRTINLYFRFGVATDNIEFPIATGGIAPLTYSVTGNPGLESLGFSFDPKTRIFKGTPTLAGAGQAGDGFAFTYRARSSAGGGFALIFVKVTVCEGSGSTDGETVCTPPDFAALGFAAALAGQSYTVGTPITALTLPVATGGTGSSPTFIYRLTSSGGLPDGLSFDAATRRLTGTPTTAKQSTLTYRVQDAASLKEFNRQFPLDVNAAAVDADTTPPTVTLDTIAEGVIGTAQDYDITFSEAVTGLAVDDFSVSTNIVASGDLMVNNVTPASGPSTTYTISITPRATAFTLTLAADSVMDTATTPNMGPATAASVSGSATAPELPLITGPATLEISENTSNDTLLGTYTTTADVRIFALITNVLDVDLFRIRPNGELRFDNSPVFSPDYEAPQDQGADNVYNLTIRGLKIVDGDFQTLVQDLDIVVTIINVDEPGAISAITGDVEVGQTLTAGTVTDEDSPVSGTPVSSITHQWQSAVDGTAADAAVDDAAWPDISSATGAIYDPGVGDVGRIIRVVATYTDGEGGGKKVASAATGAVAAAATTAPTSDTSLATLTLTGSDGSEITLTPAFMAGVSVDSPYTASVANGVTSVTIAASSTHATTNIVVVVNGAQVTGDKSPSPVTDTGNLTEVGSTPNTIEIEVTAEDGNSFESYNIHITRAGPPPGIALRRDTAADGGVNTDRLTRNRDIDVTLATGFNTNSDTWEYSTDGGVTAFVPGTGTGFTLPAVSADYAADQVRVRQTVDGIRSDFAGLDAFTIDADAPTANLGSITGAVIDQAGQTHAITFSEAVAGLAAGDFSASTGITVTAVSGSDGGTDYTITYTATAASFNLILTAGSVTDLAAWPVARTSITGTATAPLPVITGPVTLSIPENTAAGTRLGTYTTTADVDNFAVFTSVLDGGLFRIESNGELRFENLPSFSPDYEAPRDVGADNVYNLTIVGVRSRGVEALTQDLNIAVTVTNVDEPGAISAITGDAQVGEMLAAGTVTDEDSPPAGTPVSGITHQWQSAAEGTAADAAVDDSAWPDISSATGATYEPVVGDVGRIIRVVATYTDGEGGGKKVASAATGAVAAAALSTDSTLSALDVSAGTLNPAFNAATDAYAVSVGTGATSVTVTPTTTDDGATVVVNGVAVASGQPSEAIDLNVGNNTIPIVVTAEDTSTQTYTVTVARAVPQPGIALASDTARDGGINTDRITRNRSIVVTLHADFQNDRDTWEWSSNSGNSHTTGSNTDRSFDLDVAQATYNDNVVRARQTVNGVVSEFAGLAMFQHDTVKPTISLNGGGASVTITKGDAYNDPVTADDALDGPIDPSNIVITGGPVDVDTAGEYTLTYNVMDRAGNAADPLTRTVTVSEPTATTPEPPVLSAGTITNTSVVLEWTAVDNAASYTLTRVVAGGANVVVFSGNALTATDTGLTAETPYKYVVTVTVGGRTSADSNEVDATTLVAPVTTPAPTVTVERLSDNSIEVSWDNIDGVDFTIYAIKTGEADAVIIALVTSPHTIATTDPLFDTVNNADAIGVRGFAEGNPVGDHSAQITSDEVPPVDITAPPVPVITTSPATVGSTPITIDGTAEAGTTVELFNGVTSAGTVTAADGTGAFSFAVTLTEGTNTFTATASDGPNTSDASSPVVITLDTETPEAPIITTSPATVNSPSIMIVGTAEAGTTVELLNGVTSAGTVTAADGTGAFSFTVTLTEGTNTFTATASDGPNTSAASPAVVITLDTETPEAPIITTQTATVGSSSFTIEGTAEAGTTVELLKAGASAGDTVTAADSGSFSFTVTLTEGANTFTATASDGPNTSAASPAVVITLDTETPEVPAITTSPATVGSTPITIDGTAEAGATVELFNGVTSAGTVTADSGSFSFTGVALNPGANSFTATASDGVNTSAASSPVVITLDTETPAPPAITTSPATVNTPSITIVGTAEAGTTVELFNGVTSAGTVTADSGSFSFTVTLTEGTNTFTATASDGVNKSAASPAVVITLDTVAPAPPTITTSPATVDTASFTIEGIAEAGTTVNLLKGGASVDTTTADSGNFSFAVTLTEGTNTFTATASDGTNKSAASPAVVITLDTIAPAVPAITTSPATVGSTPITIVGTAEAGTTVDLLKEGTSSVGTTTADGDGNFSFAGVALTEGANSFTATASDGPNTSAASSPVVITLDTETPPVPAITTSPATVGSTPITIDGTAEAGTTVELFNGVTSAGTVTADSGSFSFTGVALNPGANSFTATASDGPNTSAASPPVVITLDTTAPAIEVILSEVARVIADQNISAIAGRVERARTQQNGASSFNFAGQQMSFNGNGGRNDNGDQAMSSTVANLMNTHASSMEDGTLDMKTLLGNSEFTMPLNFVGGEDSSGITFWGSGDYRNFGGEDDDQELDWDGDMFSVHFGLDGRTAEAIGGVALSWNEGELETDDKTTYDISLTSINPYFGWGGARGEVWMTAGYGSGELKRDNGASNDLSMSTFAIGGNGIVRQRGASTLRLKGEVSQSTLEVDANKDGSGLKASEVDTNRVRVSLESTNTIALDNGARTERSAEAGIRHDGGDGATGSGAELGFGISHVNANGFSVEGKARVLLGHDGDANEWGVSGAIKKTAGADGQGWSFALSPGYGDDAGDIQRLWDEGLRDADGNATATDTDTAADATRDYAARLDLRVGYGMNGFTGPSWLGSGRGLLTPYTAMTLSNDNNRYRLGIQWKLGNRLDLGLVGEHRDADDDDDAILLKGELRF